MNKFTEATKITYEKIKENQSILTKSELGNIWRESCKEVGLQDSTSMKFCPKNILISLYENGFLKKCNFKDKIVINENNKILVDILSKLNETPKKEKISIRKMWREIVGTKEYNSEIDVILPLFEKHINKYVVINNNILFEEGVKRMHLSYSFAKKLKHFVMMDGCGKYEFYPTNFLYAFMSFNMIYDLFEEIEIGKNGKKYSNKTKDRIEKALSYLTEFEIERIVEIEDKNQTVELRNELSKVGSKKSRIKETLYYIYSIRNNFFHGSKKVRDYIEDGQRERMYSYTNFILKFCEVFFENIKNKGMDLSEGYELEDNFINWENKN